MAIIFAVLINYFMGAFSSSYYLVRKLFKTDLDKVGSGNLGTMNTMRNVGILPGITVFALDFIKGMLSILISNLLGVNPLFGMLGVIVGHNFSVFLGFKGGKGLASGVGALFILSYNYVIILGIIGIITVALTKNIYIASVLMALAFPFSVFYITKDLISLLLAVLIGAVVIYKHQKDLKGLFRRP